MTEFLGSFPMSSVWRGKEKSGHRPLTLHANAEDELIIQLLIDLSRQYIPMFHEYGTLAELAKNASSRM